MTEAYRQGEMALRRGEPSTARPLFQRHLSLQPDDALGWFALGSTSFFERNWSAARDAWSRAAELNRDYTIGTLFSPDDIRPFPTAPPKSPALSLGSEPAHGRVTVLLACDRAYFQSFGAALVLSVGEVRPDWRVHLHLANPTHEDISLLERILALVPGLGLSLSHEVLRPEFPTDQARWTYLASMRFLHLSAILDSLENPGPLLILDADSLFRRSPRALADWGPGSTWTQDWDVTVDDSGLFPLGPLWRYWAACICIAPTKEGRTFANHLSSLTARYLAKPGGLTWMADQFSLSVSLAACEENPGFRSAPWPGIDVRPYVSDPTLALWSLGAPEKFTDPRFTGEIKRLKDRLALA
jgi:hypothetical protein